MLMSIFPARINLKLENSSIKIKNIYSKNVQRLDLTNHYKCLLTFSGQISNNLKNFLI